MDIETAEKSHIRIKSKEDWNLWKQLRALPGSEKCYVYSPKPDITAYELALIVALSVPVLRTSIGIMKAIEVLPPEAKRHFKEVEV